MSDLKELRKEIDSIDRQIQELFERRMKISEEVAAYKKERQLPVLDAKREDEKIASLKERASGEEAARDIEELYRTILSISRRLQREKMENDPD